MSLRKAAKNAAMTAVVASRALRVVQKLAAPAAVILRFHSVQDRPEDHAYTIGQGSIHATSIFTRYMEHIARQFKPVSLDDVAQFLKGEASLPARAVAITFDDGYKDNFEIAAPVLNRFGIPATFYVLVDAVEQSKAPWYCRLRHAFMTSRKPNWRDPETGVMHELNDSAQREPIFLGVAGVCSKASARRRDVVVEAAVHALEPPPFPNEGGLMMTWDDARALARSGHTVGSHTMTHPNVAQVAAEEACRELGDSKIKLEKEVGAPVRHFAYPHPALNPQWNETTLKISQEVGYTTAVTTTPGAVRAEARLLAIPRTYIPREEREFLWHLERTLLFRQGSAESHADA